MDDSDDCMSPDEAILRASGGNMGGYGSPIDENFDDDYEEDEKLIRPRTSSLASTMWVPRNSVCERATPNTVHSTTNTDLLKSGKRPRGDRGIPENPDIFARALSEKLTTPWIQNTFKRRECARYIPVTTDRCGCGRTMALHSQLALSRFSVTDEDQRQSIDSKSSTDSSKQPERWSIVNHTRTFATDSFGTISFQGGAHAHKAHYLRLSYDSAPEDIMYLFEKIWMLEPPRLIITLHGGMSNFEIQEKLGKQFREGLLKAAQTTGAWIITSGVDSGVVKHVAMALDEAGITARMRSKIVTIGIAPWGNLRRKERLIGLDTSVSYDAQSFSSRQGFSCLNDHHSYFLLADNGTSGRHGADLKLRMRFEEYLAELNTGHQSRGIPIVCAVLEGGTNTITSIHRYLTTEPRVPVIVCDGSGRASDIIAFAARYVDNEGVFPIEVKAQLLSLIESVFPASPRPPEFVLSQIIECAIKTDLLSVFRYGEQEQRDEVDHAILTAILRRQNIALADKLSFTLAWNRVDVARACFNNSREHVPSTALYPAMIDALRLERVDFVECFLEHGVSMKKFLTFSRLEQLYNMDDKTSHSIRYLATDNKQRKRITLPTIGEIIEKLMGGNYKSYYSSRHFKNKYTKSKEKIQQSASLSNVKKKIKARKTYSAGEQEEGNTCDFARPFNDLMIWAIVTRRPDLARCMWKHGEDAMAKSLCAIRLYKSIAVLAETEYIEVEMAKKLRSHARKFKDDSLALLECCYQADDEETLRLLTAELPEWGNHTCLSLAVLANNKTFLAHECCQMLLAELWHGALRVRSGSNMRVLGAILCPPASLFLSYKSDQISPRMRDRPIREIELSSESSSSSDDEDKSSFFSSGNPYRSRQSARGKLSLVDKVRKFIKSPFSNESTTSMDGSISLIEGMDGPYKKKKRVNFDASSVNTMTSSMSYIAHPQSRMSWFSKVRAFYSAPISKFWAWCLAFHIWLIASIYVLLIETPLEPSDLEYMLTIFVVVFALEHIRKFFIVDQPSIREKLSVFFNRYWNLLTTVAIILYLVGFGFRMVPSYRHSYGRSILSCSNALWHMKTLDYLLVHPRLGPYIMMAGEMVIAMFYIIVLLLVTLMSFGVSRQAITYPHETWKWTLVRNIFYKPYFMLYGEVYAGEIDPCGDEGTHCVPGGWIPPVLMTAFLLIANILLINMLIAIFNNIFNETNAQSQEVWLFQQYNQVLEYNDTPILPPPFTIITHIFALGIYIAKRCCKSCSHNTRGNRRVGILDVSMKLYLNEDEMRVLHDFEEDRIDELTRRRLKEECQSGEERWTAAVMQTELMSQRVADLVHENFSLRNRIWDMESRLSEMIRGQQALYAGMSHRKRLQGLDTVSTQSLPDAVDAKNSLRRQYTEYTSITDNIRLAPCPLRSKEPSASNLINTLRRDATLRKYDEVVMVPITRKRLNSSSNSIAHDLKEMDKSTRSKGFDRNHSLDDLVVPSIVVEGQEWQLHDAPSSHQPSICTAPIFEPLANASSHSSIASASSAPYL